MLSQWPWPLRSGVLRRACAPGILELHIALCVFHWPDSGWTASSAGKVKDVVFNPSLADNWAYISLFTNWGLSELYRNWSLSRQEWSWLCITHSLITAAVTGLSQNTAVKHLSFRSWLGAGLSAGLILAGCWGMTLQGDWTLKNSGIEASVM